jgi:hypothetical protein
MYNGNAAFEIAAAMVTARVMLASGERSNYVASGY